jgi:hypothetical protein
MSDAQELFVKVMSRQALAAAENNGFDSGVKWAIEYYESELGIHSGLSHDYGLNGDVESCEECS